MIRFSSGNLSVKFLLVFLLTIFPFTSYLDAQTRKHAAPVGKAQTSNKTSSQNKTADKKSAQSKAGDKKNSAAKDKTKDKKDSQSKVTAAKNDKTQKITSKRQAEEKRLAKIREAEEAQRRKIEEAAQRAQEEARRQTILEEKRRREQVRREAEARHRAFENSLHTETAENIANDDTEGEDLQVRRAAVNALGKHAGMVVVMEPQTGKILSIVNQDWAIRKSFKPCSTIKLVTAVAGLNENVIGEEGNIRTRRFPMNLDDALAFSNNYYFQTVGAGLGNSKMISYAQLLGLGQKTGINATGETSGKLAFGNRNARIYSHGDDFEVSPLQLAVLVSAISNGGKIVVPKIPRTNFDKTNFRGRMRREIQLPENNLQGVIPGMIGAATYGTARHGVDHSLGIAGKTGSCIADGSWVGLFASVAPVENPQVSIVVITRGEGERGKYAAAVAGKIYEAVRSRLGENGSTNLAKVPVELKPQPQIDAKTSAKLDRGEDEDSDDNDALVKDKKEFVKKATAVQMTPKIVVQSAPKMVAKTSAQPQNLFQPIVINVGKLKNGNTRLRVVSNK